MNKPTQKAYENGQRLLTRLKTVCGETTPADVTTIVDAAREVYGDDIEVDLLQAALTDLLTNPTDAPSRT